MTADRHVPGKRLRNWHRIQCARGWFVGSLREYARLLVAIAARTGALSSEKERAITASRWLAGKGARVTAPGAAP